MLSLEYLFVCAILSLLAIYLLGRLKLIDIFLSNVVVDLSARKVAKCNRDESRAETALPSYPNGWIPVLESRDVKACESKSFVAFGRDLVAFRGASNIVYVLDAYCPHLGAHIGVGGQVVGDCIRCPFHGWTFRGIDGSLDSHIDSPQTRIQVWRSLEINGFIFVWHDSDHKPPHWFPPKIREMQDREWTYRGRTEHRVNCHFQEIPENGADRSHFRHLHTQALILGNDLSEIKKDGIISRLMRHEWSSNWSACEPPEQHMASMTIKNINYFLDYPLLELNLNVQQIGPACVHLRLSTPLLGGMKGAFIQSITPIGPNEHKIVHHVYTEPTFKAYLFSKFLLYGEANMLERDIIIWNNKKFLRTPMFTKEDKSIVKFRRWFLQFYSNKCKESQTNKSYDW